MSRRHDERLTDRPDGPTMEAGHDVAASPSSEDHMPGRHPRRRRTLPIVLSLLTVLAVGLTGTFASTALMTDQVSLAAIEAHGGTLDLAITERGFGLAPDALANVLPGADPLESSFTVTNTGTIDADLRFVPVSGIDASGCFDYALLEGDTVRFGPTSLADPMVVLLGEIRPGAEAARTFTLRVENRADCATNGAKGALDAKLTVIQQGVSE